MTEDFLGLFRNAPDVVVLRAGEVLFSKGDAGKFMYVVKSGNVQVIDGNHIFETVSAGGIVGEMALINEAPRTATVKALGECELAPIDEKRFLFLVERTPFFAIRVMRVMSARLKAMDVRMVSMPE